MMHFPYPSTCVRSGARQSALVKNHIDGGGPVLKSRGPEEHRNWLVAVEVSGGQAAFAETVQN
jgi:hypothetical protein